MADDLYRGASVAPEYRFASWLFVRWLALVYLLAFVSLWVQVEGLYGEAGILPVASYLEVARSSLGAEAYLRLPTLLWLGAGDVALHLWCGAGVALSLLVLAGRLQSGALVGLWAIYLSWVAAGQELLGFQWDALLIESGLLAVFLTSPWYRQRDSAPPSPSKLTLWLLWWLLFRLMFSSGVGKLTSGDPAWRDLSALAFHYETQPLPNAVAWLAHQLPDTVHTVSAAAMLAVEIVVPFLILGSARLRRLACFALVALQLLIALTGSYAFFNLLTIGLCWLLLDDAWWQRRLGRWLERPGGFTFRRRDWRVAPLAVLVVVLSGLHLAEVVRPGIAWPRAVRELRQWTAPWRAVNAYGLFRVMTTERREIVVEGSLDGVEWRPYAFRFKPGEVERMPSFAAPHQPRLDWQMGFAALRPAGDSPWLFFFLARLAQASPEVLGLLGDDPFDGERPRFLRARLWRYRFTGREERRRTGAWWRREPLGTYLEEMPAEGLARLAPAP